MPVVCSTDGGFNKLGILKKVNPLSYYLGTAAQYSVIGTSIVNGGVTSVNLSIAAAKGWLGTGVVGTIDGSVTGTPITVGGSTNIEAVGRPEIEKEAARKAIIDVKNAYDLFSAYPPTASITGDFIGRIYKAGVYSTIEAISCSGPFYVDAENNPGAVFVFIIGGAYTPAAAGRMYLLNGAVENNIFWCYGGAFSSGAGSTLTGTVLTPGAVTVGDGAFVNGRVLSFGGRVTLANNSVTTR
jgi:hypothetical protein